MGQDAVRSARASGFGPDPATAIGPTVDEDGSVRLSLSLVVE
jgi:hypothetical protein